MLLWGVGYFNPYFGDTTIQLTAFHNVAAESTLFHMPNFMSVCMRGLRQRINGFVARVFLNIQCNGDAMIWNEFHTEMNKVSF